ncbi:MAG: hypothetical protein WC582_03285 [Patescibacteria group bacterium]
MAPYEGKGKIMKFFSYLANNDFFVFTALILAGLLLSIIAWFFLSTFFSLSICFIIIFGLVVFVSYKKNLSIPIAGVILKKEYYRIKFKYFSGKNYLGFRGEKNKSNKKIFIKAYLGVIHYLMLLFGSSEESFCTLKEDVFVKLDKILDQAEEEKIDDKFQRIKQIIKKIKSGQKVDSASLSELEKELFEFSKFKQKKATVFSLTAITALIITTVTAGLISSFLFPEVFRTRAASYGFIQTDWSGGVSALTGLHPGDQTNWNKYVSKDNVSTTTPGELSLDFETTEIWSQTSNADWQTHATSSTYYSDGSVGIAKPNGITCSAAVECDSGYCTDGYCCDTACDGVCRLCNSSGNEGTCVNRTAEDTTEGCANDCYDCVNGVCTAMTEDSDGSCTAVCKSCVAGSCANRAVDSKPSGCNASCQFCNNSGVCQTCAFTNIGNQNGCVLVGSGLTCKPSRNGGVSYYDGSLNCNTNTAPSKDCSGGSWVNTFRCDCF